MPISALTSFVHQRGTYSKVKELLEGLAVDQSSTFRLDHGPHTSATALQILMNMVRSSMSISKNPVAVSLVAQLSSERLIYDELRRIMNYDLMAEILNTHLNEDWLYSVCRFFYPGQGHHVSFEGDGLAPAIADILHKGINEYVKKHCNLATRPE